MIMELSKNQLAVFDNKNFGKQSIIFIHGYPFNHTMWNNQLEKLNNDFRVITYDLRGLGASAVHDGQYTMERMVDDLFDIMDEFDIQNPVICGLSMGGYIAFRAVEREQNKFKAAIFCDTRPIADDAASKLRRQGTIRQINDEGLYSFVSSFIPPLFGLDTTRDNPGLIKYWVEQAGKNDPRGVKGCQLAMLTRTDTTESLKTIKIPALAFGGYDDKSCPPYLIKEFAELISNCDFAIVPRAGHMSPMENADFVNDIISNFLNKL